MAVPGVTAELAEPVVSAVMQALDPRPPVAVLAETAATPGLRAEVRVVRLALMALLVRVTASMAPQEALVAMAVMVARAASVAPLRVAASRARAGGLVLRPLAAPVVLVASAVLGLMHRL